jgi:hypothetical protein
MQVLEMMRAQDRNAMLQEQEEDPQGTARVEPHAEQEQREGEEEQEEGEKQQQQQQKAKRARVTKRAQVKAPVSAWIKTELSAMDENDRGHAVIDLADDGESWLLRDGNGDRAHVVARSAVLDEDAPLLRCVVSMKSRSTAAAQRVSAGEEGA